MIMWLHIYIENNGVRAHLIARLSLWDIDFTSDVNEYFSMKHYHASVTNLAT